MPFWNPDGAGTSALGMAIWVFYLQGKLVAVNTILVLQAYVSAVDGYVQWQEGLRIQYTMNLHNPHLMRHL